VSWWYNLDLGLELELELELVIMVINRLFDIGATVMGSKKIVHSILAGAVIATFSSAALATLSFDTCAIVRVGALGTEQSGLSQDTIAVKLGSCGKSANSNKWLRVSKQSNPSLAVLLTGLSLKKKVKINAHWDRANTTTVTDNATLETIYLDQ
jgi:hypothetical protein